MVVPCEKGVLNSAKDVIQADLDYICASLEEEFSLLAGKQVLVVGGAGFLGHYLVQAALHWNRSAPEGKVIGVTVYDNFIRGVPPWLQALDGDRHLRVAQHDVVNPLPQDRHFDYIFHAASIASPIYYRRYPIETMDANVNGLRHLLEYCMRRKEAGTEVAGLLFFSSSEIYGDPPMSDIPTPETFRGYVSCTGPRACYDESKRYGETLCVNFARRHDIPVKVARPFNNYGPGLKISDRRVIPDLARDILSGRDMTLLSDGSPRRTFCYVADAVVGYYKILVKGRGGEAYNVGVESPEVSVAELAEELGGIARELFDYQGKVVRAVSADSDYLVDNPNRRCPVIAKAREELGFNPSISLHEGLRRLMVWYSENRVAEDA